MAGWSVAAIFLAYDWRNRQFVFLSPNPIAAFLAGLAELGFALFRVKYVSGSTSVVVLAVFAVLLGYANWRYDQRMRQLK